MFTTTVTIGRNVTSAEGAQAPMSDIDWLEFQQLVAESLRAAGEAIASGGWDFYLSSFHGQSFWNGIPEHSTIFQLLTDIEIDWLGVERIRELLKDAAAKYHQECIAFLINQQAMLVPARQPHEPSYF